jgi:hypothetical protein
MRFSLPRVRRDAFAGARATGSVSVSRGTWHREAARGSAKCLPRFVVPASCRHPEPPGRQRYGGGCGEGIR